MSNDWKKRLQNPNRRKQVFSKKLDRWLDASEEKALLELLAQKQKQIVDAIAKEADVEEEPKEEG